jgi:glycosyltransferase involved in cell wall biosynthesis
MTDGPRLVAVAPGPPLAPETFSGTSVALLRALERRGALVAAVDGRTTPLAWAEKAASFSPSLEVWKQRYNAGASPLSPLARRLMSSVSSRRAARHAGHADVLLQMTGWFDPGKGTEGMLRCSYHDGNLAGFLRRPDLSIDPDSRWVRRALDYERRLYDSIDLIFCMSERLRRSFLDDFGQAPEKVVTVAAGANIRAPEHVPERALSPPRFLFVGKQFERKGGPTVLAAFRRLRAERPDCRLVIVGPAGLKVDDPGVQVVGRIGRDEPGGEERLTRVYEEATAFVMPSLYEPLGVAVLEAMAYALPCIGSTEGALSELIVEGRTGHLVPPGDEHALLGRMRELATHPEVGRGLGRAGFDRFHERFTWDAVAERMLDAIALSSSRRSRRGG